ncbi:hypothetical protein GCM10025883_37250 [Mobilicoccus caccae]|uniref:Uncharacterized protein n=1 Tax=Mobilicoccus caccae TaxID=1859295 RepID=A0ABQ6IUT0_9MICO|nr:hypothetical protein GCM10025883_37250 [Mobilicoccus caccae]
MPSHPKAVLHDFARASVRLGRPSPQAPARIGQFDVRLGQGQPGGSRQLAVLIEPLGLQRRCGRDDLEHRARRVGVAADGTVDQRPAGVLVEVGPCGLDAGAVVPGEAVGVEIGVADHREDRAGAGIEGHDGTPLISQPLLGGLLGATIDAQLEVDAAGLASGDDVAEPAEEQARIVAGQELVGGTLEATARAVDERVVAGDVAVRRALRVAALVGELVLGALAEGHGLVADEDLAALAAVGGEQGAPVAGLVAQLLGLEELDPRRGHQQRAEHDRHDEGEPADRVVHDVTTA